jgi:CRISPR-associated protein Csd1
MCHVTKDAHIVVVLDEDGNIQNARPITNKNYMTTIIPATEDSASKTGGTPASHPFVEELRYLAKDYVDCGGKVPKAYQVQEGGRKKRDPKEMHEEYRNLLADWCNSAFSHPKARAVLKYIEKGTLVKDLARFGVLYLGTDGKFLAKKDAPRSKDTADIYAVPGITDQQDAVVRWRVEIDDGTKMDTWRDDTLWQSWQDYYLNKRKSERRSFCYVTGEDAIMTNKHPKYLRRKGDNPKLISSNDTEMINYYGRLESADASCLIGFETSQKAHNALVWLIDRQGKVFEEKEGGKRKPSLTILAWESSSKKQIPQPFQNSTEFVVDEEAKKPLVGQDFATRLNKSILGYKADLKESKGIFIIALDALSQGRMAITYYQEFQPEIYLENIEKWHRECAWEHWYLCKYPNTMTFAPALLEIAEVIHGKKADSKIKHHTVSRLLPCIVEGRFLPRDVVDVAVRQASKRMGLHDPDDKRIQRDDEYTWRKTLTIACALVKKYMLENNKIPKEKENDMALDPTNTSRDYLYGRLLAIADHLETKALRDEEGKQKRPTNAARMMQQFSQRPYRTWKQIHDALPPYLWQLKSGTANWYKDQIAEVCCKFVPEEFKSDDPLTGEYLLGYYCQWQELRKFVKISDKPDTEDTEEIIMEDENDNTDNDSEE